MVVSERKLTPNVHEKWDLPTENTLDVCTVGLTSITQKDVVKTAMRS